MTDTRAGLFLTSLQEFITPIQYFGALNSVAQRILHLTAPGIPDIYQGTELLDLSLVDPDNRRPVDFSARRESLDAFAGTNGPDLADSLANITDGRLKLLVTQRLLCLRREHPELFTEGEYHPLRVTGDFVSHVVAFERRSQHLSLIVIVPRFAQTLMTGRPAPPLGDLWKDTAVHLSSIGHDHKEVLTGRELASKESWIVLEDLFRDAPMAVLLSGNGKAETRSPS